MYFLVFVINRPGWNTGAETQPYRFRYIVTISLQAALTKQSQGSDLEALLFEAQSGAISIQTQKQKKQKTTQPVDLYDFSVGGRIIAKESSTQERGLTAPNALLPEDSP